MGWRQRVFAVVALCGALASVEATAQTLYAASVRSLATTGGHGVAGSLYTVNLGTGSPTFVAPVRLNGSTPIGLTGMAAHPQTGVFYAITSPLSTSQGQSLVTVDVSTGNATLIGEIRHAASDISFNRAGILFAWLTNTSQLGIVSLTTGAITPIGTARGPGPPAGLAIDARGVAFITPSGAGGSLDMVDIGTGSIATGPALTEAPFPSSINSMTFTPSGLLLAVNSNAGVPANTRLVTINLSTGKVSNIGNLPDDTDALAFTPEIARTGELSSVNVQTLALLVLGAIALILGLIGWAVGRKPRT
jgi:hypothetical protein